MEFNNKKIKGNGSISFIFLHYGTMTNQIKTQNASYLLYMLYFCFSVQGDASLFLIYLFGLTQVHKIGKKWSCFLIHLYCFIFFFYYFYLQFYLKYIYITLRHPACFCIPVSFLFPPRYKSYNINSHTNFLPTLLKQHFCSHLLPI